MKLTMRLGADSYDIVIKRGALGSLGQLTDLANRKVFIVTDTGVPIQYAETVKAQCADGSIFVVPQGEASKSIKVYTTVLQAMLEFGMTRADLVVAVGGGVVGDMAGFAAATYMRGIQFINAVNSHIDQKKVHLKLRKGKGKNTTESPETTVVEFPTETKEEENAA